MKNLASKAKKPEFAINRIFTFGRRALSPSLSCDDVQFWFK